MKAPTSPRPSFETRFALLRMRPVGAAPNKRDHGVTPGSSKGTNQGLGCFLRAIRDSLARTHLDRFPIGAHVLALAIAFALAVPSGWDREKKERTAGLRTFPLVALASCGFVQACENMLGNSPDGMSKVIEGVITGIGFIGGGAILKHGNTVHGTATAASLWATAAVGVSVALGSSDVA